MQSVVSWDTFLDGSKKTIGIDSKYLEQVKSYKYLGSAVNGDNFVEEEIKEKLLWALKFVMPIKKYLKAN